MELTVANKMVPGALIVDDVDPNVSPPFRLVLEVQLADDDTIEFTCINMWESKWQKRTYMGSGQKKICLFRPQTEIWRRTLELIFFQIVKETKDPIEKLTDLALTLMTTDEWEAVQRFIEELLAEHKGDVKVQ